MSIVAVMLTYRLVHFTNVVLLQKLAGFIRVANILKRFGGILGTFIEKNLFTTRVLTGERVNQKSSWNQTFVSKVNLPHQRTC
jgi:hypothetical protein